MVENVLRLRLRIRRNGLPETRIVFLFNASNDATVSKFLEQVNETIPLEADDWGLEDYVVELQSPDGTSFECLHFQPVSSLLDKDEEIVIRSLSPEDIKKRRISGRSQIANDGRHLLDGVPFGRPLLKRPHHRPPIHISPRKRRRTKDSDLPSSLVRFSEPDSQWDSKYDEYDNDFDPDGIDSERDTSGDSDDSDFESTLGADELQLLKENSASVTGQDREKRSQADLDTRSTTSETSTSGSSDTGDSHSTDSSENDDDNNGGRDGSNSDGDSDGDNSSGDGRRKAVKENVDNRTQLQDKARNVVKPLLGKACTRRRNARRRVKQAIERARKANLLCDIGDKEAKELPKEPSTKLITAHTSSVHSSSSIDDTGSKATLEILPDETLLSQRKRRRLALDAGASRRILLTALGIQGPNKRPVENGVPEASLDSFSPVLKTTKGIIDANAPGNSQASSSGNESHIVHWGERINYRAVECCDAKVDLCEPPFPFVQRWKKKHRQHNSQATSHKKKIKRAESVEQTDGGREGEDRLDKSTSLSRAEVGSDSGFDLPQLPVDLSTLPLLLPGEASVGMVITWKRWALSKKTNWQPHITDATALILDIKDEGTVFQVRLSQQDRLFEEEEKVYDEETGERVYDRFEAPADVEEDEGDNAVDLGIRQLSFSDFIEPRVLRHSVPGK